MASGYQGDYKKYTKEQIVAVLSSVKEKIEKEPPTWEKKVSEVVVDQPFLYSEILKTVPKDARVEFVDVSRNPSSSNNNSNNTAVKPVFAPKVDYKNKALRGVNQEPSQIQSKPPIGNNNKWRNDGAPKSDNANIQSSGENASAMSNTSSNNHNSNNNFVSQNRSGSRNRNKKSKTLMTGNGNGSTSGSATQPAPSSEDVQESVADSTH